VSQDDKPAYWKKTLQFSTLGLEMGFSVVFGLVAGYYLDKWLGTGPIFLIILLIIGFIAGFKTVFVMGRKMMRDIKKKDE
jgi:ATP synthase protein I